MLISILLKLFINGYELIIILVSIDFLNKVGYNTNGKSLKKKSTYYVFCREEMAGENF